MTRLPVEKRFVTPANAGAQKCDANSINNILDSGVRRNDESNYTDLLEMRDVRRH